MSRTLMDCTSDTNTVCACLKGYYLEKIYGSANEWMCKTISVCDSGYEIIHPGKYISFPKMSITFATYLCEHVAVQ